MGFNTQTFNSDNWHRDTTSIAGRDAVRTRRWGMRVTVYLGVDAGDYVLSYNLASTNLQDNANWLKVAAIGATWGGGGGANIYNSDGILTGNRLLNGDAKTLTFDNLSDFIVTTSSGSIFFNTAQHIIGSAAGFLSFGTSVGGLTFDALGFTLDVSTLAINSVAGTTYTVTAGTGINFTATTGDITTAGNDQYIVTTNSGGADPTYFQMLSGGAINLQSTNGQIFLQNQIITIGAVGPLLLGSGGPMTLTSTNSINFTALDPVPYLLNSLAPVSPTTEFFRGDGTWGFALGQAVDTTVTNPTAGEDGYVIAWNDANQEYELVVQSGGGASPGGPTTAIQFNTSGTFDGESQFTYDTSSNTMAIINGVNQTRYSALGVIRFISGVPQMLLDNDELSTPASSGLLFRIHPSGTLHLVPDNGIILVGTLGPTAPILQSTSTNTDTDFTIRAGGAGNIIMDQLPTAAAGLPAGGIWNNGGVLNIV